MMYKYADYNEEIAIIWKVKFWFLWPSKGYILFMGVVFVLILFFIVLIGSVEIAE